MSRKQKQVRRWLFTVMAALLILARLPLAVFAQHAPQTETVSSQSSDDPSPDLQLTGAIEEIGDGYIVVATVSFDITNAQIDDNVELAVGDVVEVEFYVDAETSSAIATEVALVGDTSGGDDSSDDSEDLHVAGAVEAVGENTLTVAGITFDTTNAAIDDEGVLEVGVLVHVQYYMDGENAIAVEVEIDSPTDDNGDDNSSYSELIGTLEAINDTSVVVSGLTIDTTSAEMAEGLEVGMLVKVEFDLVEGVLVAIEVYPYEGDPFDDECVIEQPEGWTTYTVQFGDTLSGIAAAADMSLSDLIEVNCIDNPSNVPVGTVLFVEHEITGDIPGDDNGGDDNGGDDNGGDDSGDDNSGDDNGGDDSGDDNSGDDNGGDDNGGDDSGDDSGDDNSGDDNGGDDNGGDDSCDDNGDDDSCDDNGGDDNGGGDDDGGGDDNGGDSIIVISFS